MTDGAADMEFVDGSARLDRLLERPGLAEEVQGIRERMAVADRAHAMTLAMVRRAAGLTQSELAKRLEVTQAAVARAEQREDMLLSTLRSYLTAAGAKVCLVVTLTDGTVTQVSLDAVAAGDS